MYATRLLIVLTGALPVKVKDGFIVGALILLFASSLGAQQPGTTVSVDSRTLQELLARIADLEQSQRQLRDRVAQLEQLGVRPPAPVSSGEQLASSNSSPNLVLAGASPRPE